MFDLDAGEAGLWEEAEVSEWSKFKAVIKSSVRRAIRSWGRDIGSSVVDIAGGQEKCVWLIYELGFDDAIDY